MNEKDYKEILAKLTLDEKITMLSGSTNWLTQPVKRDDIDIPAVRMSDGPSGLRREKIGGGVNIMQTPEPATCFPAQSQRHRAGTKNSLKKWDKQSLSKRNLWAFQPCSAPASTSKEVRFAAETSSIFRKIPSLRDAWAAHGCTACKKRTSVRP